jgi:hypothetical protein
VVYIGKDVYSQEIKKDSHTGCEKFPYILKPGLPVDKRAQTA